MRSIGRMRHKVQLVAPARVSDGALGYTRSDNVIDAVYADVKEATGREVFRYSHLEQELSHVVTIRYNEKVRQAQYLDFEGRKLYVLAVIDPTERKEWMKLIVREGGQT